MEQNADNKYSFFEKAVLIFSSILVLQTLVLIILMIQLSDSKVFRISIGFCGTGIAVVSIVMGMLTQKENQSWKIPFFNNINTDIIKIAWLLSLIYTVITLFYKFNQDYIITHSLYRSALYTGSLVLTTSLFAFIWVGIRVIVKNPAKAGAGFIIARMVLVSFFIWMFYIIYEPIFFSLLVRITKNAVLFDYISKTRFNMELLTNIKDVYSWHISALIGFISQYRFYTNFIWIPNLTKS